MLSDSSLAAAQAFTFTFTFTLNPELVALRSQVGNDLPALNGNGQWALSIPASFLVKATGHVSLAQVEPEYRQCAEPLSLLETLQIGRLPGYE